MVCVEQMLGNNLRPMSKSRKFSAYPRLNPLGIGKDVSAADLVDHTFLAYNGGRLREAAQLLTEKMLPDDGFIGMSLTGALTPAGLAHLGTIASLESLSIFNVQGVDANSLQHLASLEKLDHVKPADCFLDNGQPILDRLRKWLDRAHGNSSLLEAVSAKQPVATAAPWQLI